MFQWIDGSSRTCIRIRKNPKKVMDLPVNDNELETIIKSMALRGDTELYQKLNKEMCVRFMLKK